MAPVFVFVVVVALAEATVVVEYRLSDNIPSGAFTIVQLSSKLSKVSVDNKTVLLVLVALVVATRYFRSLILFGTLNFTPNSGILISFNLTAGQFLASQLTASPEEAFLVTLTSSVRWTCRSFRDETKSEKIPAWAALTGIRPAKTAIKSTIDVFFIRKVDSHYIDNEREAKVLLHTMLIWAIVTTPK